MHALDWLDERGRILHGAFQPIEGVHFYFSRYRSRYRGLCDRALTGETCQEKNYTNKKTFYKMGIDQD